MSESNVRRLRASQRFKLFRQTRMRLGPETFAVHLVDLSVSGALVVAVQPPAVGTRVYLRLLGGTHAARVVRRDGRNFGVEFVTPLADTEVAAILREDNAAAA